MKKILNFISILFLIIVGTTGFLANSLLIDIYNFKNIKDKKNEENINKKIKNFSNMYVLGDSLSDVGTMVGSISDFLSFYNFNLLSKKIYLSEPFYKGKSFSDGPLSVEYLAKKLGFNLTPAWRFNIINFSKNYFNNIGNDYAFAGSQQGDMDINIVNDIKNKNIFSINNLSLILKKYLMNKFSLNSQFNALVTQHKLLSNDLVVIESGNNDIFNILQNNYNFNEKEKIINNSINSLDKVINRLLNKNVKNIIVTNIIDLSKTPEFLFNKNSEAKKLVSIYNKKWNNLISKFNNKNVKGINLYNEFEKLLKIAKNKNMNINQNVIDKNISLFYIIKTFLTDGKISVKYNLNKSFKDLNNSVFLDSVHPTKWMQEEIGKFLYNSIINWNQ